MWILGFCLWKYPSLFKFLGRVLVLLEFLEYEEACEEKKYIHFTLTITPESSGNQCERQQQSREPSIAECQASL